MLETTAVGGEAGVEVEVAVVVSLPIACHMAEAEVDVAVSGDVSATECAESGSVWPGQGTSSGGENVTCDGKCLQPVALFRC